MRRQTYPKRGADKRSLFAVVMMVHLPNYWNVVEDKPVQYVLNERPQHQKAKEDTDPFGCGERPGARDTCDSERCDQQHLLSATPAGAESYMGCRAHADTPEGHWARW